jgi:regulation of enolase protein 1 (concanavalin A-like superfamily)
LIDADGTGKPRLLPGLGKARWYNGVAWSPDGQRIVFTSPRQFPAAGAAAAPVYGPGGSAVLRDRFQGKLGLNWKIIRPDPSHFSLTKNPGRLTVTTQRGTIHGDVEHDALSQGTRAKNIFLLPNPLADGGDFRLTLSVSQFQPTAEYHQVGLICYNDDANYVKWSFEYSWQNPGATNFILVRQTKMEPEHDLIVAIPKPSRFWLRITKQADRYECAYITDGRKFTVAGKLPWGDGAPRYLGFLAKNGGNPEAPEIDVCIDWFELVSPPGGEMAVK